MSIQLEPEIGIPFSAKKKYIDLRVRAEAACNTAMELAEHGLDITPTAEDKELASKLALAYAEEPEKTSKAANDVRTAALPPATLLLAGSILKEFGRSVATSAAEVRHLITNKLLLETEHADPRIRLKALELLGKISDVALFTDKSEITVTHQSTEDLRSNLRSKLEKLVNPPDEPLTIQEGEFTDLSDLDVDSALGLKAKKKPTAETSPILVPVEQEDQEPEIEYDD